MRIAAADDEEILLSHLRQTLEELVPDAEVLPFSDTAELLEAARTTRFDAAFLDIQMPGMTGLALAQELVRLNNRINIIFVTGYDGYQGKAMELFASGYVRKPVTAEKLEAQLRHLRYPVSEKKRVYAQTFGNFTLFVDDIPVKFSREKEQMVLAYLVHRRGALVSKKELSAVVFEDGVYDNNRKSYISKLCAGVAKKLEECGVPEVLVKQPTTISVNCEALDCDLYDYLAGKPEAVKKFHGEYMSQYYFGEDIIPYLDR